MALPTVIDHCPRTPECGARLLYIELAEGQTEWKSGDPIYYVNAHKRFIVHDCSTRLRASVRPEHVYLTEWVNKRTKRTRYMGPFRTRKQAETEPKDDKSNALKRGNDSEWALMETYVFKPAWKKAPPKLQ